MSYYVGKDNEKKLFNLKITFLFVYIKYFGINFALRNKLRMNKALLYILLFIGISLGVFLAGGLLAGILVSVADRSHDLSQNDSGNFHTFATGGLAIILVWGAVQHYVFLRNGYASYTMGRLDKSTLWKMALAATMGLMGLKILERMMISYSQDADFMEFYGWLNQNPLLTLVLFITIIVTTDLVIFGGIFREINDHFHKPMVTIPVAAGVCGILLGLDSGVQGMLLSFLSFLFGFWIYECTRSILPIVIGDTIACFYELVPVSWCANGWLSIPAIVLILCSIPSVLHIMRYKE